MFFLRFTAMQCRLLVSDRQLVFWNLVFFTALLLLFLGPLSGGDPAVRVALTAALVTTALMANALFSVGVGVASARERGVFRRYWLAPLPAGTAIGAVLLARWLIVCAGALLQIGVARLLFGVPWSGGAASWVLIVALGSAVFTAIGFLIAAAARAPHVANTLSNLVLMPMMALGGTALPPDLMPDVWADMYWVLPPGTILDGLLGAFVRGEGVGDNLSRAAYLAAWVVVFTAVGTFRWTRREP